VTVPADIATGVAPGDVLAGKYRVERVLGAGGMGVVVAAYHVQLETKVALKFLLPGALSNPEAVARFVREARAAVKITGEHVARVSDVGQLENGSPYIVMEYLEGIDLSAWLRQRGALPIELAVDFVLQASEAIADAHALGIVHRDLKPANLFCIQRSDGQLSIKVLDFGISKFTAPGTGGNDMTRTTALVGSPYYMSPEQLQSSKAVDARADIWSLGIILFELVSGRIPFEAEAVTELAIKIAMDPTPMVRAFRAEVPPALEQVIATCLEKDRSRRYQTVGDLAIALQGFGSRQAHVSVERILGTLRQAGMFGAASASTPLQGATSQPVPMGLVPNTSASWGKSSSLARPGGKAVMAIAIASFLVICAVGGVLVLRRPRTASNPAPVPAAAAIVTPSPAASAVVAATQVLATPEPIASEAPSAATTATVAAAPTVAPTAPPAASPVGRPNAQVPHVAASGRPAVATGKPSCDPPYYFDAQGARIFKKECL
jgi:eukaryotic-like serine/threonine-protein kinase